jgi:Protein of unknown function (DUF4232)
MSDLEQRIRKARDTQPAPEHEATERARAAVLAATPGRRSPRRSGRLALGALAFAAALAGAFAAGLALAPGGATKTAADGPGFLPAQGWDTFQTGVTAPPRAPSATAANVTLGADALSGTFPWQTVARLQAGQALLQATFYPAGENAGVDAKFPRRALPLSLDDARAGASLEGQPANVTEYRLLARVNGYDLDLFVFFGRPATAAARAAAEEELGRLTVPEEAPAPAAAAPPATRPSRTACRPSALRAKVFLNGATGSLLGGIQLRNVGGTACTLRGRPAVELRDANGVVLNVREMASAPLWKQLGAARPRDWPTTRLTSGGVAQVFVRLRNWCVAPVKPVFFHVRLPGAGESVVAPARITVRCDAPQLPVGLAIGPVEPVG